METVALFKEYLEHLFAGRRSHARHLIFDAHDRGFGAEKLLSLVIWPAMEQIANLYREHHISRIVEHMAVRINRKIADQLQPVLPDAPKDGRRIIILCGQDESAELGASIASDLFESQGWTVWFIGSGVANDEILKFCGQIEPDMLMVFSSTPPEVPNVRKLIALIREIGICQKMRIMLCGGIYSRAEDLAEEIKADVLAHNVREALCMAEDQTHRIERSEKLEPGRRRKRKRKHRNPLVDRLREELGLAGEVQNSVSAQVVPQTQAIENIDPVDSDASQLTYLEKQ